MDKRRPAIHFVERVDHLERLEPSGDLWESGNWVLSEKTAEALLGGWLFLHRSQSKASHFGGLIVGYRVLGEGESDAGRLVIRFRPDKSCKGVFAGPDGWGQEKKLEL